MPKPARSRRPFLSIVLFFLLSPIAHAFDTSLSAGVSTTASNNATPVVFVDVVGATRTTGAFRWQPVASLGAVGGRDVRADLDRDVIIGGIGIRLVDWWRRAFFSTQVGYATRTTAALSSHGQFISSLGWQGDRYVILLRHISNADAFGGKNLGETMLLAGVSF